MGSLIVFSDRDAAFMCKFSARLPLGESEDLPRGGEDSPCGGYIGLPRGGRTPAVGVTFSPVGKGLPLGGRDGPPRRGEDSPWV